MNSKIPWITIVLLSVLSLLLMISIYYLKNDIREEKRENGHQREQVGKLINAIKEAHLLASNFIGQSIQLDGITPFSPKGAFVPQDRTRLLIIFDEISCNVCAEQEVVFGKHLIDKYGTDRVFLVLRAEYNRYAAGFVRANQPNFSTFLETSDKFFKRNDINVSPLVLLLDPHNRVIAAYCPIPGQEEWAEPFRKVVKKHMERENVGKQ